MIIPIFYKIETVNKEKLHDVLMGNISLHEAHELKARMIDKRKRKLTALIICAVVFVPCLYFGLSYDRYRFDEGVMLALTGGIFLPFFVVIFKLLGLAIAMQYLGALKNCRPGSNITFTEYRRYNLDKANQQLLEKIASCAFNTDEAYGILNMAKYQLALHTRWAIFGLIMGAVLAIFAFFMSPYIMTVEGETETVLRFMAFVPKALATAFGIALLLRLYRAEMCKKYIRAIIASYILERPGH
jgi:hypothetical protein